MIWTILGLSVGIVALFCITVAEFLAGKPVFESSRAYAAVAMGVMGGALWITGRFLTRGKSSEQGRGFLLWDLRYWGPMLLTLGVITLFIRPFRATEVIPVAPRGPSVVAKVEPPKPKEPEPVITVAKPATFPALKVQGVFLKTSQPMAVLNGKSYAVGDVIGDVLVKEINRDGVLVELAGQTKVLTLN